jgi:hypothetical protein
MSIRLDRRCFGMVYWIGEDGLRKVEVRVLRSFLVRETIWRAELNLPVD